ncbi:MAG TPA: DUF3168 domain-containing protein [Candidatus Saccharibacteria bacterium]|nr:DUF3168 domain-containing protein [Candidatus Saccharibacteria bacterium]
MIPSIFPLIAADQACKNTLGSSPVRFFQFGFADQNTAYPYAVWQQVGGEPENYLGNLPDTDTYTLQLDVYGKSSSSVIAAATALRDAIEPRAHVVSWRGQTRESETKDYRVSFDIHWIQSR